jgi:hypothetical protein
VPELRQINWTGHRRQKNWWQRIIPSLPVSRRTANDSGHYPIRPHCSLLSQNRFLLTIPIPH